MSEEQKQKNSTSSPTVNQINSNNKNNEISTTTNSNTNTKAMNEEIKLNSETGLGFTKRDSNVKQQEELGKLSFEVIQNDGTEKT